MTKILLPFAEGSVLLLDKPLRWTSFDVVKKVRILTGVSKVGHAGTLDPLASGLLIVCTGKFTKRINEYMAREKEYTGSFTLGAVTDSYDLETEPRDHRDYSFVDRSLLDRVLPSFTGPILQIPPAHSAIKKEGRRVYELARKGVEVKLEPRPVMISQMEITSIELPVLKFKVVCSTGTYIRSLASDLGAALGTGAYLSSLCRTRIGEFKLDQAETVAGFQERIEGMRKDDTYQNG